MEVDPAEFCPAEHGRGAAHLHTPTTTPFLERSPCPPPPPPPPPRFVRPAGPLSLPLGKAYFGALVNHVLSNDLGFIRIGWKSDAGRIGFRWKEQGGPRVKLPERKGFGSVLIERAFPAGAAAESESCFEPDGLLFQMTFKAVEEGQQEPATSPARMSA